MEWLGTEAVHPVKADAKLVLARRAAEADPDRPGVALLLGGLYYALARYPEAIAAHEQAAAREPDRYSGWAQLSHCFLKLGRLEDALAACDRGLQALGEDPRLRQRRGAVLAAMARPQEAVAEFRRALGGDPGALLALLQTLSAEPDAGALLAECDALPAALRGESPALAFRAVALSRLGRTEEARAIIDIERQLVRLPFEPPAEFRGIEAFNRMIASEVLADPPDAPTAEGQATNNSPRTHERPAMLALLGFMRASIEQYLADLARNGGLEAMPAPPSVGRQLTATNVLTGRGSNGEHIHPNCYISAVYHVQAPEMPDGDDRGALLVGGCRKAARGHEAAWGERRITPVPGWLTIHPSHLFHDVIPTRSPEPRISVAVSLSLIPPPGGSPVPG